MSISTIFFIATLLMSFLSCLALASKIPFSEKTIFKMMQATIFIWFCTIILFVIGK